MASLAFRLVKTKKKYLRVQKRGSSDEGDPSPQSSTPSQNLSAEMHFPPLQTNSESRHTLRLPRLLFGSEEEEADDMSVRAINYKRRIG